MKRSFQRLSNTFKDRFGRALTYRGVFKTEFYKRYTTEPQRNTSRDRGTIVSVDGTDWYLKPGYAPVPHPNVNFQGVEVTLDLTKNERYWLENNMMQFGWTFRVGTRMGNKDLLVYIPEYDQKQ